MVASIPPKTPPSAADLMAQLAAARGEVAESAVKSRALRKQMLAEGLAQAAQVQHQRGADDAAAALSDDAKTLERKALDLKA
ncbi:MAG: hypothetical protein ACM31D_14160 [Bacteroidota bacterium]